MLSSSQPIHEEVFQHTAYGCGFPTTTAWFPDPTMLAEVIEVKRHKTLTKLTIKEISFHVLFQKVGGDVKTE